MPTLDIICPTWNNPQYFNPCVKSIIETGVLNGLGRLIVVNNGQPGLIKSNHKNIIVLEPGTNLGWERGLEYGLKHSDSPFVCFQNDDTHIPPANWDFYSKLLVPFQDNNVAAVGPMTTVAAGWHSIFSNSAPILDIDVSFLIFFTVALRRADYDAVGGIDTTCPGGDDIDLSIRLRQAGKKLKVTPRSFLVHHGFKSGTRLRGDADQAGGWNSIEMREETNRWLIQKHGFRTFFQTMNGIMETADAPLVEEDREGDAIRLMAEGEKVLELASGFRRTVPQAVCIDRVPAGDVIPHVPGGEAVSDVVADVTKPLPFDDFSQDAIIARHILEHCLDTVQTLKNWNRVLKVGGKLIIAVPNEALAGTIPLNPEHVHAFTPQTLTSLLNILGFREVSITDPQNGVSFIACYEKVLHMAPLELAHV